MKYKNLPFVAFIVTVSSLLGLFAFFSAACGTPAQNIATANYLGGNAYATYELGKNPASASGLQHLVAVLPLIPSGKVTAFEMGQLNAELAIAQDAAGRGTDAYNQLGALISAVAQANAAANGGNPTINTAIITAALTDAANGIQHGLDFWRGQQAVTNPKPATP